MRLERESSLHRVCELVKLLLQEAVLIVFDNSVIVGSIVTPYEIGVTIEREIGDGNQKDVSAGQSNCRRDVRGRWRWPVT